MAELPWYENERVVDVVFICRDNSDSHFWREIKKEEILEAIKYLENRLLK